MSPSAVCFKIRRNDKARPCRHHLLQNNRGSAQKHPPDLQCEAAMLLSCLEAGLEFCLRPHQLEALLAAVLVNVRRFAGLLQLLADQSWHSLGIPVEQLPSLVVAHGVRPSSCDACLTVTFSLVVSKVLDSLGTLNTKNLADLCAQCHRTPV